MRERCTVFGFPFKIPEIEIEKKVLYCRMKVRQLEETPDFSGEKDDHEMYQHPSSEIVLSEMTLDLDANPGNQVGAGLGVIALFSWETMCKRKLHLSLIISNPKVLLR